MSEVALGFRIHLGWAAAVAVARGRSAPDLVDRRRLELADTEVPESHEPYHKGEGLPADQAAAIIARGEKAVHAVARVAVAKMVRDLEKDGHRVVASGILRGAGRTMPSLEGILASHAWVHTAEGELMRASLVEASQRLDLTVLGLREKTAWPEVAERLRVDEATLRTRIDALAKELGSPWRQDQKLATLAAWLALRTRPPPAR